MVSSQVDRRLSLIGLMCLPAWQDLHRANLLCTTLRSLVALQIDLRYADAKQGDVIVVVAPVLRFKDVGFNANVTLEDLGALGSSSAPETTRKYMLQPQQGGSW